MDATGSDVIGVGVCVSVTGVETTGGTDVVVAVVVVVVGGDGFNASME